MTPISPHQLSRRERQILDILFRLKEASAVQVLELLPDPPGNAAVRKWLSTMEEKGLVQHRKQGRAFIYSAKVSIEEAKATALRQLVDTFFDGKPAMAAAALLEPSDNALSNDDRDLLLNLIDQAEQEGR